MKRLLAGLAGLALAHLASGQAASLAGDGMDVRAVPSAGQQTGSEFHEPAGLGSSINVFISGQGGYHNRT